MIFGIKGPTSLRSQFFMRTFVILLIIAFTSGGIQLVLMKQQMAEDMDKEATMAAQSIRQGIEETDLAVKAIEQQINLKMIAHSKHIADLLGSQDIDAISNEKLKQIQELLQLDGITLFVKKDDDIVGVKATDPLEIGFSFKQFGPDAMRPMNDLLEGNVPRALGDAYVEPNILVLPIAQSGSHTDKPTFFKYAYYHPPGLDYFISLSLSANEVYQFTNQVGPDAWIQKVIEENPYVEQISVLNPRVFAEPELETKLYPPLKKVVYGNYDESWQEENILINMVSSPQKISRVHRHDEKKVYEMFVPINQDRVIYIAMDYGKLTEPLYRHSIILILSGLVSLVALFLLTATFFNRIYENINRIKKQIKLLEAGDFTAKSYVDANGGELTDLSESTNRMVDTLHRVLSDTNAQANKVEKLAVILEADASESLEKLYAMSMEETSKSREAVGDIFDFLDRLESHLRSTGETKDVEDILNKIDIMRQIAQNGAAATTEITITLSDLLKSLHHQSTELSDISQHLLQDIMKFKLSA
jgi:hypothetical protein